MRLSFTKWLKAILYWFMYGRIARSSENQVELSEGTKSWLPKRTDVLLIRDHILSISCTDCKQLKVRNGLLMTAKWWHLQKYTDPRYCRNAYFPERMPSFDWTKIPLFEKSSMHKNCDCTAQKRSQAGRAAAGIRKYPITMRLSKQNRDSYFNMLLY